MMRIRSLTMLLVAPLAAWSVACSSTSPAGGSGGMSQGRASGGATTTGSGGTGSGGMTASGGSNAGASGGTSGSGGTPAAATGGNGAGTGGNATGGSASVGSGGSASGGVTGSGGAASGGAGAIGGAGGAISGGTGGSSTGTGGTAGAGASPVGTACPALPGAPAGVAPLPSAAQVAYQRTEMTSFIHYGMSTYDGSEQCSPSDSPSIFNPSALDATAVGQWITALKAAGFRQSMLVTKHSCGFCLWPSQYTSYSVKSSPWDGGKGDVVQLFADAMKANDMKVAFYLSPWDQKYPSSASDYETYFKNQLGELMAHATPYEFEFDGFNSPTGGNVNWKTVFQYIKQKQPDALIWAGPEIVKTGATPDIQWVGNENGTGSRSTSSLDTTNCGGGNNWCAYECNTSSHRPDWFWHPNSSPMALADMQKVYFQTVGMNCTLNFNVPPSQSGAFDPKDLSLLQQFATWYGGLYQTDLIKGAPATADSTWATAGFEASKAVDDDICTYWAGASGKTSARLEVTPAATVTGNLLSIREAIELGERVKKYHVEIKQNGTWNTAPTDASGTKIQGTVIGQRQLWKLSGAKIDAVALVVDSAKDTPTIAEFSIY